MDTYNRTDRRYQRTHELIINSTIELAVKTGWKNVSVTKLAEKANINRNSFYLHFESIIDVFDEIEERFTRNYSAFLTSASLLDIMIKDKKSYNDIFIAFLDSEKENIILINRMGRGENLLTKILQVFISVFEAELLASEQYAKSKDIILPYVSGCAYIYFSNLIKNMSEFDVKKHTFFSVDFIDQVLKTTLKN